MSDHDLVPTHSGDLAPYSPSQPLAPSPDDWGLVPDADYLSERGGGQLQIFGELMPPGTTPQQVEQAIGEIAGLFMGDMSRLGHPAKVINAAIEWYRQAAISPPRQAPARHRYNLFNEQNDPMANSFGNAMTKVRATQEFVTSALWFLNELNKRSVSRDATAVDGPTSSGDPLDQLSDAEYNAVLAHNEQAKAQTEITLRRKWGHSYQQNIATAQEYLNNLPAVERNHLDQYTTGFIHSLNTVEVLEFLFNSAIGRASIPTSGGAVASEISEIEEIMKFQRKLYNNDLRIQARLRTLYDIRDKL